MHGRARAGPNVNKQTKYQKQILQMKTQWQKRRVIRVKSHPRFSFEGPSEQKNCRLLNII